LMCDWLSSGDHAPPICTPSQVAPHLCVESTHYSVYVMKVLPLQAAT
jgi:hypothetical protein